MNRILKKFLQRGVDLSPVGVELREDNTNYFCTPKGASVFGWAGIDGIHFCFIRGFGEMVFSVSPMKPFSMKTLQPRNNSKLYRKFQRR